MSILDLFRAHCTVQPWELALVRRDGEPTRVLGPGRHALRRRTTVERLDTRERLGLVPSQELLTADGVTVRVSASFAWVVADPVAFTERAADPVGLVYLAIQLGLREAVSSVEAESLVRSRPAALAEAITARAQAAAAEVGITVLAAVVKDVVLPADLRSAYAEVVVGRQRATAQLEAARAETAALRSLANGAKLLDEHPALAQLRLVQALPMGSRVELVQPTR